MDQGDFFDIIMPLNENVPGLLDHIMESVANAQTNDQLLDVEGMPDLVDSDLEDDVVMPSLEPISGDRVPHGRDPIQHGPNPHSHGAILGMLRTSGTSDPAYATERNHQGSHSNAVAQAPPITQPDASPSRRRPRAEDINEQEDVSQPPRNRQRVHGPTAEETSNVIPLFSIQALSGDPGDMPMSTGNVGPQTRPRSQSNPATPSLPMHDEQPAPQTGPGAESLPRLPQPGGMGFVVTFDANGMPRVSQPIFGPPETGPDITDAMDADDRAAVTGFGAMLANLFQPPPPEKDDPDRARRLVEALEDVPEGLVQRMEQIAKTSCDEAAGCAICWDGLRNEEGAGFSTADADAATTAKEPAAELKPLPRIVSLPCSHVFHSSCLLPWFARPKHTTCPTCRFNLDPDNLTRTRPAVHMAAPVPVNVPPVQTTNPETPAAPEAPAHDAVPAVLPTSTSNIPSTEPAQPSLPTPEQTSPRPPRRTNGRTYNFTYTLELPDPTFVDNHRGTGQEPGPVAPAGLNDEPIPTNEPTSAAPQPTISHNFPPELGAGVVAHIRHAIELNLPTFLNMATRFPTHPTTEDNPTPAPAPELLLPPNIARGGEPSQAVVASTVEGAPGIQGGQAEQQIPPAVPVNTALEPPAIPAEAPEQTVPPPLPTALPRFADFFAPPANLGPGMIPGPLPTEFPPFIPSPFGRFMSRGRNGRNRGPRPEWSLPDAPGLSIRQRVEKRERELGLRCSDASCGVGPSDEEPISSPSAADAKQVAIRGFHAPGDSSKHACDHRFHPSCLVSAERVAGWSGEKREEDQIPVACPACRCHGYVEQLDWESGVQALAAAA